MSDVAAYWERLQPKAIEFGKRRRRRAMVMTCTFFLASAAAGAAVGWMVAR